MVIDILVGIILLISALISFLRGFIREVLTIFGTLGAIAAAFYTGPLLSPLMRGWLGVVEGEPVPELFGVVPYTIVADALSYGLVFVTVLIFLSILSHVLAEAVRKIGLGAVDRSLGVVFGLARGFVILALIYIPVNMFAGAEKMNTWFAGSKSRVYIELCAGWLSEFLPDDAFGGTDGKLPTESEARKKLEDLKLLNGDTAKKIEDALKSGINPGEVLKSISAPEKGYTNEFRQQMDQLFKQEEPASAPVPINPTPTTEETKPADVPLQ